MSSFSPEQKAIFLSFFFFTMKAWRSAHFHCWGVGQSLMHSGGVRQKAKPGRPCIFLVALFHMLIWNECAGRAQTWGLGTLSSMQICYRHVVPTCDDMYSFGPALHTLAQHKALPVLQQGGLGRLWDAGGGRHPHSGQGGLDNSVGTACIYFSL